MNIHVLSFRLFGRDLEGEILAYDSLSGYYGRHLNVERNKIRQTGPLHVQKQHMKRKKELQGSHNKVKVTRGKRMW